MNVCMTDANKKRADLPHLLEKRLTKNVFPLTLFLTLTLTLMAVF